MLNREPGPKAAEAADGDDAQTTEVTLLVDGEIVKKSLKEVTALAQQALAGDNRLDEAKRLLNEAKAIHGRAPENPPGATPPRQTSQPDPSHDGAPQPENPPAAAIDRDKLRGITERIQVGDNDDGAEAPRRGRGAGVHMKAPEGAGPPTRR